jgi:hypothetical protein
MTEANKHGIVSKVTKMRQHGSAVEAMHQQRHSASCAGGSPGDRRHDCNNTAQHMRQLAQQASKLGDMCYEAAQSLHEACSCSDGTV